MADVDNRNRNRRPNRAGQPNPKREARAKAAERHVAAVSETCAKDIERSLAGVREFDGMPAGFVAAMKAKAQAAAAALADLGLLNGRSEGGNAHYYVSDTPDNFDELEHRFLGEFAGGPVEKIAIETY